MMSSPAPPRDEVVAVAAVETVVAAVALDRVVVGIAGDDDVVAFGAAEDDRRCVDVVAGIVQIVA